MPLPIRDGNQSLTTLSTLIVNSAHVPAHTVVSLGSQAITDIAQAVSGVELGQNTISALENISVTISAGTSITIGNVVSVTGGLTNAELRASSVTIGGSVQISNFPAIQSVSFGSISGSVTATISGTPSVTFSSVQIANFPATQTVTFTQASVTFGTPIVTGSVSVLNFPATQSVTFTTAPVTFGQASVTFGQAVVSASNIEDILSSVGTDNTTATSTKFFKIGGHQDGSNQISHIVHVSAGGAMKVDATDSSITFGAILGTVTVGNSITIANFPATQAVTFGQTIVTGSVSVLNLSSITIGQVTVTGGLTNSELRASPVTIGGSVSATISGTPSVTFSQASVTFGAVTGSVSVLNFPSTQTIAGTVTANVDFAGANGATAPAKVVPIGYIDINTGNLAHVGNDSGQGLPSKISEVSIYGVGDRRLPDWLDGDAKPNVPISGTVTAALDYSPYYDDGSDSIRIGVNNFSSVAPATWLQTGGGEVPISGMVTANLDNVAYEDSQAQFAGKSLLIGTAIAEGDAVYAVSPDHPLPVFGSVSSTVTGTVSVNPVTILNTVCVTGTVRAYGFNPAESDPNKWQAIPLFTSAGRGSQSVRVGGWGQGGALEVNVQTVCGSDITGITPFPVAVVNQSTTITPAPDALINLTGTSLCFSALQYPNGSVIGIDINPEISGGCSYKMQYSDSTFTSFQDITVTNLFTGTTTVTMSSKGIYLFRYYANIFETQQNKLRLNYISGAGTANVNFKLYPDTYFGLPRPVSIASVTIGNSVTIGSLPAISGTVTVGNFPATQPVSIASVTIGNSITIGSFSTSVTARLVDPTGTAVSYASTGTAGNPSSDVISIQGVSGGTSVPVSISSVTIGAVPNGALTTRFGSVATANTAQISSAVTNTSRKYLLIQNVTTSSNVITVGIGFTPTTTQGIQLSAGAGITFESSYIPTGAVYILSSVTASPFTILEA